MRRTLICLNLSYKVFAVPDASSSAIDISKDLKADGRKQWYSQSSWKQMKLEGIDFDATKFEIHAGFFFIIYNLHELFLKT